MRKDSVICNQVVFCLRHGDCAHAKAHRPEDIQTFYCDSDGNLQRYLQGAVPCTDDHNMPLCLFSQISVKGRVCVPVKGEEDGS